MRPYVIAIATGVLIGCYIAFVCAAGEQRHGEFWDIPQWNVDRPWIYPPRRFDLINLAICIRFLHIMLLNGFWLTAIPSIFTCLLTGLYISSRRSSAWKRLVDTFICALVISFPIAGVQGYDSLYTSASGNHVIDFVFYIHSGIFCLYSLWTSTFFAPVVGGIVYFLLPFKDAIFETYLKRESLENDLCT